VPYTYTVEGPRRLVRIHIDTRLLPDEIPAMVQELSSDPRITPDFVELIDCSAMSAVEDLRPDRIRSRAAGPLARVARRAFVAPQPAVYGMCRMFATYFEMANRPEPVGVFRTIREAEEWLGLD